MAIPATTILAIIEGIRLLQAIEERKKLKLTEQQRLAALSKIVEGTPEEIKTIDTALEDSGIAEKLMEAIGNAISGVFHGVGNLLDALFGKKK